MTSLEVLVQDWLRVDKNATTRAEIQQLWDAGNTAELERRLRTRIEFGTAGLRGRMEAGWSRMNDVIIIQASQGLCQYVLSHVENASDRGVVIGHDHRHNSERWAQLTAAAFLANNVKVYLHRGLVHTPLVPFSVKELNAACGVMITASHNPKQDNGYKVYWQNAVQIISPHDEGISQSIKANLEPKTWDIQITSPLCIDKTAEMKEAYFANLLNARTIAPTEPYSSKFVNTSMHGVGEPFVSRVFELYGLLPPIHVKKQMKPDPDFPTVAFPNPEEKGALDMAMQTADAEGISYVLAQDPDADRFAAAEKQDGKWLAFTGDQLGVLFASYTLETYRKSGKPLDKLAMVASTVSSKMVEAMAQVEGFKFVECLTGFKYIGNTALDLVKQGYEVPFGYEEAIGFMFGSEVRDKDGVYASVIFAQMVEAMKRENKTVKDQLDDLYRRYGYFQTSNSYFTCTEPPVIDNIFTRLRNYNGNTSKTNRDYPTSLAGLAITRVVDLTTGYDSSNPPTFQPSLPISSGHMIQFRAENAVHGVKIVLTIRTSGTEPKIKYYLEGNCQDATKVKPTLLKVVGELATVWMEADKNGLA